MYSILQSAMTTKFLIMSLYSILLVAEGGVARWLVALPLIVSSSGGCEMVEEGRKEKKAFTRQKEIPLILGRKPLIIVENLPNV